MRIPGLGLTVTRQKKLSQALSPVTSSPSGWWPIIREPFTGAWQRNLSISVPDALTTGPVFVCVKIISSDIAKMEIGLIEDVGDGIWEPTTNPAYTPVLRKPNHYQNRISFVQSWITSKLIRGNTYVLKGRDSRGVVDALYVLDPTKVQPMIADNGDVYYALGHDPLAGLKESDLMVPAREIIHDLWNALYHPLVGLSPIHACSLPALQGLKIRRNSATFFDNQSTPSGILVAPGNISEATAKRLEDHWNDNYAGPDNAGKIAALGDGLKFEPLTMTAKDSQSSEQLKESSVEVCNAFGMPAWLAGYGQEPNYNNGESKYQQYYSQCLQILIEALELCLDEGLNLPSHIGIQCDLDALIRMDSAAKMDTLTKGVRGGVTTPNEGRRALNRKPLTGGDTVFLQDQDHSLEWLARRDAMPIEGQAQKTKPDDDEADDTDEGDLKSVFGALIQKELAQKELTQ